jgi:hypothetical protein
METARRNVFYAVRDETVQRGLMRSRSNIAFVIHVKHLGVILIKRIAWRLHVEMIEAKT